MAVRLKLDLRYISAIDEISSVFRRCLEMRSASRFAPFKVAFEIPMADVLADFMNAP